MQESEDFVRIRFLLLLFRLLAVPSVLDVFLCCILERGQPETQGSPVHSAVRQL
jgi:hypothetical protein